MTFAEELHAGGLPYIDYKEGFRRWGIPNCVTRDSADISAIFHHRHPDAASVFVDDDNDGKRMAVVPYKIRSCR